MAIGGADVEYFGKKVGGAKLKPTYNGIKTQEEMTKLEEKVIILENHLYSPQSINVAVSKEKNHIVVEAKDWSDIIFSSEGNNGTKRIISTRAYVSDSKMRVVVSLDNQLYDLRSTSSVYPYNGDNPFA